MPRPKGSKNKPYQHPVMELSVQERIQILASLIVDAIIEDQKNGKQLLKKIKADQDIKGSR